MLAYVFPSIKVFNYIYNNFSFRNGCLTWSITSTHPRCTSSTFASSTSHSKFSIEFFKEGFHNQIQKYSSFMNAVCVFLAVQLNCSSFKKSFIQSNSVRLRIHLVRKHTNEATVGMFDNS